MDESDQIRPSGIAPRRPSRWRKIVSGHPEEPPRRGYRFPLAVEAELHDPSGSFLCAAENLSRTGVLLVGSLPPPAQEQVDITLKDRSGSHKTRVTGKVVRASSDDVDGLRLAIEFVGLNDDQRDGLEILLARLLESGPPPGPLDALKPGASPLEIKKALEAIPLPQRRDLATRASVRERDYLRLDSNPAVLDALVRNPNLALAEARAVATSGFLSAPSIDALASDPRFGSDEELILTLAVHPRIALTTGERLTASLKPPQLRRLLAKPGLNPALRDKLLKRLTRG